MSARIKTLLLVLLIFVFLAPNASAEEPIRALTSKEYGPDKHILYTLLNMGGYAAGCLGEGTPLFGGDCVDMVGSVGGKTSMSPTPVLVSSSIRSGGALGALSTGMIALGSTPPAHPVEYLADLGQNFGIKPAYAQVGGSGASVISPILDLWKLTRNFSYFGFILVFMSIGFMIMFRQKLNPQTVISAQNALPGVVIAMILVTFSYFIAALIIDLGFVTTQLTGRYLASSKLADEATITQTLEKKNLFDMFGSFMSHGWDDSTQLGSTTAESLKFLTQGFAGTVVTTLVTAGGCYGGGKIGLSVIPTPAAVNTAAPPLAAQMVVPAITNKAKWLFGGLGCAAGGAAGFGLATAGSSVLLYGLGIVLYVVLLIALIIAMFKTFFELIKAYITIIFQTVIGPIVILIGAIPGNGDAFTGWAKTILANVLIFPAVFSAFFFAAYIKGTAGDEIFGIAKGTSDSFNNISTVPLLGGLTGEFIRLILTYGILLVIPTIPGELKKAMKVQDGVWGPAAVGGVAAGYGAGKNLITRPLQPWIKQAQALKEAQLKAEVTDTNGRPTSIRSGITRFIRPWV